jgi:hypothetical protein
MSARNMVPLILTVGTLVLSCNNADFSAEQQPGVVRSPVPVVTPTPAGLSENPGRNNESIGNSGGNGNNGLNGNEQNAQGYALTCRDAQPRREELTAKSGTSVVVKGEICPQSFGRLTVLFVVDFSGSMEQSDPRSLFLNCGRLAAANAIVKKIEKDMSEKDDIRIGLISFDDTARVDEQIMPLKDFKSNLNTFELCGANQAATNYKSAFDQSRAVLNGIDGNKLVYFISDGMPTLGGDGPQDNNDAGGKHKLGGTQAMQALQQNTPNLTVNAVFLNKGQTGQAEFDYLSQLTGNASRVRVASSAAQLADKVVELSIPRVVLNESAAAAFVETTASGKAPLNLKRFSKDPTREGIWTYETNPIPMAASPGATTLHTITITAPDLSGNQHQSSIAVNFKAN